MCKAKRMLLLAAYQCFWRPLSISGDAPDRGPIAGFSGCHDFTLASTGTTIVSQVSSVKRLSEKGYLLGKHLRVIR